MKCCWVWKILFNAAKMCPQCGACTMAMSWGGLPGKAEVPVATADENANLVGPEILVVNTTGSSMLLFLTILCFEE